MFKLVDGRSCVGGLAPNAANGDNQNIYPTVLIAIEYCRLNVSRNSPIDSRDPHDFGWSNEVDPIGYDPSLSRVGEFDGAFDRGFDGGLNAFENKELMDTKFGEFNPIDINKDSGVGNQFVLESNSAP